MRRTAHWHSRVTLFTSVAFLAVSGLACSGGQTNGATTVSQQSSAGSVAGTSAGSTTGAEAASSGSTSGGSATGSSTGNPAVTSTGANGTTGTTTGAPPVFIDGGYVSCTLASAADAGPDGDGGPAFWNCSPGSYFCDPSGTIGSCFQCQSDADCANSNLPTYDSNKPHCDLGSGVSGYQHFCQQCLANADCTGNPNGSFCALSTAFPPNSLEPPIESVGFETCNGLVTDCRVDGGPICGGINQSCDLQTGQCATKAGSCGSDDDCVGYLSPYNANTPEPYCSDGGCNACPDGVCPNGFCTSNAQCANGTFCDLTSSSPTYTCKCTDSSQCGGLEPVCVGIQTNDAGQTFGTCACDDTSECGDAGLACITTLYGSACGVPCNSPEFPPSCQDATSFYPVCNPQTGVCGLCTNDNQCRNANDPQGPRCDVDVGGFGNCGCDPRANDCPAGQACQPGTYYGTCGAALSRCTPESCGTNFCNWDSGACVASVIGDIPCITDFDCALTSYYGATCVHGQCLQCQSNADCVTNGAAATGGSVCCLPGVAACNQAAYAANTCVDACSVDADCSGNTFGGTCIIPDGGFTHCGCGSDNDCATYVYGHHCDRDPEDAFYGYCVCASNTDCSAGQTCPTYGDGGIGYCASACFTLDAGACADGYFCDPSGDCRPRCDTGNQCQGGDSLCDTQNVGGQNGAMYGATTPGVSWCYACVLPSDCPAGQGCDPKLGCGTCATDANCPTGTACVDGGLCQPTCSDGSCPSGEVCDVHGVTGFGSNICYGCLTAADCPNGEGCNSQSHTCGTCYGPNATGTASDCAPAAVCSNYWTYSKNYQAGTCLANCDRTPCPSTEPICALYPGLTPDHKYCFACLKDSDCGADQRCNLEPVPTFTCVAKPQ